MTSREGERGSDLLMPGTRTGRCLTVRLARAMNGRAPNISICQEGGAIWRPVQRQGNRTARKISTFVLAYPRVANLTKAQRLSLCFSQLDATDVQ